MVDKPLPTDLQAAGTEAVPAAAQPPRGGGMRGPDSRDTVAELAERAQLISQEAGSKVAAAMKDVISAAAGIAGFAIESARDLVQFMVRRGQMTQDEADKLIRQAEEAHDRRPASEKARPTATKLAADRAAAAKAEAAARAASAASAMAPHAANAHRDHHDSSARSAPSAHRPTSAPPPAVAKSATPKAKDSAPAAKRAATAAPAKPLKSTTASKTAKAATKPATKAVPKPAAKAAKSARTRPTSGSSSKAAANGAKKGAAKKKR